MSLAVFRTVLIAICCLCVAALPARGGMLETVDQFKVVWGTNQPWLPPVDAAWRAPFRLQATPEGWTAGQSGQPGIKTDLKALAHQGSTRLDAAALDAMALAMQAALDEAIGPDAFGSAGQPAVRRRSAAGAGDAGGHGATHSALSKGCSRHSLHTLSRPSANGGTWAAARLS